VASPQADRQALALAVLAGALHGLCFPPWSLWALAFVAPAPLLVAVRSGGTGRVALCGWLAGTVASAIAVTPWITAATLVYFRQSTVGAVLFATAVGQVFHALPTVAFALGARRLEGLDSTAFRIAAVAGLWTGLELLRSRLFTGAPWDLLGHALYAHPLLVQPADLGGVFLLSFGCVLVAASLAEGGRAPRTAVAVAGATLALWAGYGTMRLHAEDDGGNVLRIALVQGAVPNSWRADPARAAEAFTAMADTTRLALAERPALVVWSENAVSFLLEPNARFGQAVAGLLGNTGAALLLGAPRFVQTEPGRADFFNAAFLLDAQGTAVATYDKRRLVPFAEYAPLPSMPGLGWRFDAPGDYTAGSDAVVFRQPAPFGVLICFEAIYPDLARDLVRGGAEFLVNISNDAWFGTSAGLEQHFAITVFRAVEQRRALARATNTGITGVVGPSGRVLARFPEGRRDAWTVSVPRRTGRTTYARVGDTPAVLAAALALAGLVRAGRRAA
jgi:apolipoprotein N-acyltransferase